ncbi:MAG: formylglycine-generating enzyme family protein [Gemmatimonadetes bacterium]|jgi:formylglycine-generating enzyme required for sulfatase activity|nr:formylglycine-generating enzyme family protein [Gemmatimonadota bacterium]
MNDHSRAEFSPFELSPNPTRKAVYCLLWGLCTFILAGCANDSTEVVDLPGGMQMEFTWIGPGSFTMGSPLSDPYREDAESPRHQVTVTRGFFLGKYEVTQQQWEAVTGEAPWAGRNYAQENPTHPAVYISWDQVQAFIHRLNQAAGDSLYRLPTEAEWEYAARAGTTTRWSFGDDEERAGDYAWYAGNAWNKGETYAHPVGTKLPNPWGLHDMHGNVFEWVQDWHGPYAKEDQVDPIGPATGTVRVVRGGAICCYPSHIRSANRGDGSPDYQSPPVGVRLLKIK